MKINRTWSVDVEVAKKMRQKGNQSLIVNNLLKKHLDMEECYGNDSIAAASDLQLAAALSARIDDNILKDMLIVYIQGEKRRRNGEN